jgi:hypothetical protein
MQPMLSSVLILGDPRRVLGPFFLHPEKALHEGEIARRRG